MASARRRASAASSGATVLIAIAEPISTQAGFEIGSAMAINTVAPEDAAETLRRALANA